MRIRFCTALLRYVADSARMTSDVQKSCPRRTLISLLGSGRDEQEDGASDWLRIHSLTLQVQGERIRA